MMTGRDSPSERVLRDFPRECFAI
ncbi:MAG: hypothetical protein PWQ55_2678, partial [Chloroflexota bacterium]|nr:hypothetical protein [Chloroflexota bacterium]